MHILHGKRTLFYGSAQICVLKTSEMYIYPHSKNQSFITFCAWSSKSIKKTRSLCARSNIKKVYELWCSIKMWLPRSRRIDYCELRKLPTLTIHSMVRIFEVCCFVVHFLSLTFSLFDLLFYFFICILSNNVGWPSLLVVLQKHWRT